MVKHFIQNPVPSSFMIASIIGFLISATIIWEANTTYGFTLVITFGVMFLASVYNFTHAPIEEELDIHGSMRAIKKSRLQR